MNTSLCKVGKLIATVTLGKYPTIDGLRGTLVAEGHEIGGYAEDLLAKMPIGRGEGRARPVRGHRPRARLRE